MQILKVSIYSASISEILYGLVIEETHKFNDIFNVKRVEVKKEFYFISMPIVF